MPSCSVTSQTASQTTSPTIQWEMIESRCEQNSPGLRAESIPRQLEDLEAKAKQDRVLIPYRAHQNSQHHRLERSNTYYVQINHHFYRNG